MKHQHGTILLYGALALAIIIALGGIAKWLYDAGGDARELKISQQQKKDDKQREAIVADAANAFRDFGMVTAADLEKALANIAVKNTTIIQPEVRHEVRTQVVLTDPNCSWPVTTLRLRNNAREQTGTVAGTGPAASGIDSRVPATSTPGRLEADAVGRRPQ